MKPQLKEKQKEEIVENKEGNLMIGEQFIGSIWSDGKSLNVSLELAPSNLSSKDWWMIKVKVGKLNVANLFLHKEKKEI